MNDEYIKKYQDIWESRASIRSRPRKLIDFTIKGDFFPEDKQVILLSKDVVALGDEVKERILIQSFYKYLHDIVNLENDSIISVCNKIIYNKELPVEYPREIKFIAYTVIIDEYYHIYIAEDMINQLKNQYPNIMEFEFSTPDSQKAIELIKSKLDKKYHDIFEIIAVCIFETTLVKELVEFFYTENIHPSIKYYVNDHMNDEAKHYGYFYKLLEYTWENLSDDAKGEIGQNFAIFVKSYLNITSEKEFNLQLLSNIFGNKDKSQEVVSELYKGFDISPEIPIVKNVMSVLQKVKILDHERVKESFRAIGWKV